MPNAILRRMPPFFAAASRSRRSPFVLRVLCACLALGAPAQRAVAQDAVRAAGGCLAPMPGVTPLAGDLPLHRTFVRADSAARFAGCSGDDFRFSGWQARIISRSGVPDGRGAGGAPATVGATLHLRAGLELRLAAFQLRIAPELVAAGNGDYLTFPGRDGTRSSLSSPFYTGTFSADLPSRPGLEPLLRADFGESGIWLLRPRYALAVTTALPDWGPGVGEGLVLGRSTAGLPRIEAATWQPVGAGLLRARWFAGTAVESRFFDRAPDNDQRSVAGLRLSYEQSGWTVGVSRSVMRARGGLTLARAMSPLSRLPADSTLDLLAADLLFADANTGTLAWFEGVRQIPLRSFRDFTLMPTEGLAFRVGASQRIAQTATARWILGAEAVRLDQPAQRAGRGPQDLYTHPVVVHGWTHRGQPLGSGLGPGGQRQFLSLDREGRTWSLGGFLERVRWNDDAMYREFLAYQNRHDVTLQLGLRGGRRLASGQQLDIALSAGQRLNYLFQNDLYLAGYRTDDVRFAQLTLSLRP